MDQDGYFWFVGRSDDVINTAGHLVGPFEVESALIEHPSVAEAAVVGFPHDIKGQGVYAYVTLMVGKVEDNNTLTEIKLKVRQLIGPHASPDKIQFTPALPKTRSGKIMRRLLKANELGLDPGDITTLEE